MIFKDENEARLAYPCEFELLDDENAMQCPHAKYIKAGDGSYGFLRDLYKPKDLVVIFDIGSEENYLWTWISCGEFEGRNCSYIDEYYEVPKEKALKEVELVQI